MSLPILVGTGVINNSLSTNLSTKLQTYEYLSAINIVLVCALAIICYFDTNIPAIYSRLLLTLVPILFLVNYFTLGWLSEIEKEKINHV